MKDKFTETYLKTVLGKELSDSDVIDRKLKRSYRQIEIMSKRKKPVRKAGVIAACMAAVVMFCTILWVSNPVLAARLPVIGRIFQAVEKLVSYKGDYSSHGGQLAEPEGGVTETNEAAQGTPDREQEKYVQESGGIKITASEAYYDSMALYLAFSIENDQGFPQDFIRPENMNGYDRLELISTAEFDFSAAGLGKYVCDPALGTAAPYYIEGKFEDQTTFAGIIRVDLQELLYIPDEETIRAAGVAVKDDWTDSEYIRAVREKIPGAWESIEIPEQFDYMLRITDIWSQLSETDKKQLHGPDGTVTVDEPVKKHYEGEWKFTFDVVLDTANTTVMEINDVNEAGFGIKSVTKTLYELQAEPVLPNGAAGADYVTAVCDADGKLLDSQGDIAEIYSLYGRNTGKITVYICEYETFMEECKGENAWKLPEKAVYQKEIVFK